MRITESRSSARALTKKSRSAFLAVSLIAALVYSDAPVRAHQPVILNSLAKDVDSSPILLDGTTSFAVYANFTKTNSSSVQTRYVRFLHQSGDRLTMQYLIPDTRMMNKLGRNSLPQVSLISPNGKIERIAITERTPFFERFSGKRYLYLARIERAADPGLYTLEIRTKRAAFAVSAVLAVGVNEVPGEVLEFGRVSGQCPERIEESEPIAQMKADQLIGMKEDAAKLCADLNAWGYRVGMRDGEFFAVTKDYRIDRITVSIVNGMITEVQVG